MCHMLEVKNFQDPPELARWKRYDHVACEVGLPGEEKERFMISRNAVGEVWEPTSPFRRRLETPQDTSPDDDEPQTYNPPELPGVDRAFDELFDAYVFATTYDCKGLRKKIVSQLEDCWGSDTKVPSASILTSISQKLSCHSPLTQFFFFAWAKDVNPERLDQDDRREIESLPPDFLYEWLVVEKRVSMAREKDITGGKWSDATAMLEAMDPCQWHEHGDDEDEEEECREAREED
ncbi:hypothetical protein BU16DRAFT_565278 [Lophium mytilinum]|uniref:Uncharacterized protein n=1 Tax=Lophium mytilinum TaxID=390894 RepID=A0A6A6QGP1_9PEZI|nr:hypothetical protein BU16DRAFT_565278 [Lophium mytilinum]